MKDPKGRTSIGFEKHIIEDEIVERCVIKL